MTGGAVDHGLVAEVLIDFIHHDKHAASRLLRGFVVLLHRRRRMTIGTINAERGCHERHSALQLRRGHSLDHLNIFERLLSSPRLPGGLLCVHTHPVSWLCDGR